MNLKNIIVFSLSFVLIGFFSSSFLKVELNADALSVQGSNTAKIDQGLEERIKKIEENMLPKEEETESASNANDKELVETAYLMSKYKFLNARADAGVNYPIIEKVKPDSPMEIIDQKDKWYRVKLESGNIAWVASWVVEIKEEYR